MDQDIKAVALKYPKDAEAPFITAKEGGFLAKRMLEIARENNIPVVKDPELVNVLSLSKLGQCIPEETWMAVASIFAYITKTEGWEKEHESSE